jgi:hypothetical protein
VRSQSRGSSREAEALALGEIMEILSIWTGKEVRWVGIHIIRCVYAVLGFSFTCIYFLRDIEEDDCWKSWWTVSWRFELRRYESYVEWEYEWTRKYDLIVGLHWPLIESKVSEHGCCVFLQWVFHSATRMQAHRWTSTEVEFYQDRMRSSRQDMCKRMTE